MDSELKSLGRVLEDTKTTATEAKNKAEKPHLCKQEIEIGKLREWQLKAMNLKIPLIISLLVLIIAAVGQYFTLRDGVDDAREDLILVRETLKEIKENREENSKIIEKLRANEKGKRTWAVEKTPIDFDPSSSLP